MFRSTSNKSSEKLAFAHASLVAMNNAALLPAYNMLGLAPGVSDPGSAQLPQGAGMNTCFDIQEPALEKGCVHPALTLVGGESILEAMVKKTTGKADAAIAIAKKSKALFASLAKDNSSDFQGFISGSETRASQPGENFDPEVAAMAFQSSVQYASVTTTDIRSAGVGPCLGFREDYRPENAPSGPKKTELRKSTSAGGFNQKELALAFAKMQSELLIHRLRGAGKG